MVWVSAIQHLHILLVLLVIQSERCSFSCPRSRASLWNEEEKCWLFSCLYPASISLLLLLNPLTLSKAAQQPAPSFIELNCKSAEAAVGASHPFQFCVPVVPPMGPGQTLRKCSQHLLIEPSDEINFSFSKKSVIWSQLCLVQPRLSHKTEHNFWSSAYPKRLMDSVSPFQQCYWRSHPAKLDSPPLPPIRKNETIVGSQLKTTYIPTYRTTRKLLTWTPFSKLPFCWGTMEDGWPTGGAPRPAAHAAGNYSALILRKPARTTAPGSVSLLRVTNSPLDCQRWGVSGRGQSGSQISGENTNQKETLGLSAWFVLAVGSVFF